VYLFWKEEVWKVHFVKNEGKFLIGRRKASRMMREVWLEIEN